MPSTTSRVDSNDTGNGTRMIITTTFPSLEAMEQLIEMGAKGMKLALGHVTLCLRGWASPARFHRLGQSRCGL